MVHVIASHQVVFTGNWMQMFHLLQNFIHTSSFFFSQVFSFSCSSVWTQPTRNWCSHITAAWRRCCFTGWLVALFLWLIGLRTRNRTCGITPTILRMWRWMLYCVTPSYYKCWSNWINTLLCVTFNLWMSASEPCFICSLTHMLWRHIKGPDKKPCFPLYSAKARLLIHDSRWIRPPLRFQQKKKTSIGRRCQAVHFLRCLWGWRCLGSLGNWERSVSVRATANVQSKILTRNMVETNHPAEISNWNILPGVTRAGTEKQGSQQ